MLKKLKLNGSRKIYRPSRTNTEKKKKKMSDLLGLTPKKKKKRCPFHHRVLECKSRKLRDTGVTGKFGLRVQNETGKKLTEFC